MGLHPASAEQLRESCGLARLTVFIVTLGRRNAPGRVGDGKEEN